MTEFPAVDVVIPVFGRVDLLQEAITSVREQSYPHWNLWIVDDASPEPLATRIRITDPRIHWMRLQKNSGPGVARNAGAAQGKSPFIAFLDSDDLWHPEKLSQQMAFMSVQPQCQWLHANELWLRDGIAVKQKSEHRKQGGQFLERAFERCLIATSAVLLRRPFFESHGGFAPHFFVCEDFELWLRLLAASPVGYLDEALVTKRAGVWEQLSATPEIDRFRVLALHRSYRQIRGEIAMRDYLEPLLAEAERKSRMLAVGATKHGNTRRAMRYQAWLTLFNTRRTRAIR